MNVKFPSSCNTYASKWSFAYGQKFQIIDWHNEACLAMTAGEAKSWRESSGYNLKRFTTLRAIKNAEVGILQEDFFNGKVPDHVHNGEIFYPPGLNQDNEGSVKGFMLVLFSLLDDANTTSPDHLALIAVMLQANADAKNQKHWNATIEDFE